MDGFFNSLLESAGPMTASGHLKSRLDRGEFVITAEIAPGLTASAADILAQAAPFRDRVDAVNITDCAGARVAMSSLAAAALLVRDGIEPVWQITCRDRNRIAIAAEFLGAAALGIHNVLVLKGDDPAGGDEPDAKPVFDLESTDVIALAHRLNEEGKVPSGREIRSPTAFHIGAADVPFDPPDDWRPEALLRKIDAGAGFVQTQFCFDPGVAGRYFERLADLGLTGRAAFIVGVGPIASARSARWMRDNLFGVTVPDGIIERLENAPDPAVEGQRICVELIEAYRLMPGVAGVHIMAPAQGPERIVAVLNAIGR
jgi:methylenetetrahydrofolate reductase (NADPH)